MYQVLAAVIFASDKHFRFVDLGHRGFKGNITVNSIKESSPTMGLLCRFGIKVKLKLFPYLITLHAMKMYGDWSNSSSIYHWNQVKASFMPQSLYHEEKANRKKTSVLTKNQKDFSECLHGYSIRKDK